MATLQSVALGLSLAVIVLFGAAAVLYALWRMRRQEKPDSEEFFLTARRSVGSFTIAWAFYAGAMGSGALFGPPSYGIYAGTLGVIMYAVACGLPIFIIGALGGRIHDAVPNVLSFADFVNRRFGMVLSLYVGLIMLFNMGIAITAEYTAVGDLFTYVIGTTRIPVVVTIGAVSILYTAVGGLYVSLITDQWQAGCSVVFIGILVIYVGCTLRAPIAPTPDWSNYSGLSSIGVMPISLITSTLFSEAMWQRCWATENKKKLMIGSFFGGMMVILAVMTFGMGGLLVLWSGQFDFENGNPNTVLFILFQDNWIIIIVTLLAVIMSESAVDSLQNAIVDTMATMLATIATSLQNLSLNKSGSSGVASVILAGMRDLNLGWLRSLVVVLNIAPIIVSLKGYSVLQLFLMANLITTCTAVPVLCGIIPGRVSRMVVTPFSVGFGCANGIASLFWWTRIYANMNGVSYDEALYTTFLSAYDWPPFFIGLGASIVGMLLGAVMEYVTRRLVPAWREYPPYDFAAPAGAEGPIFNDSTLDLMARAHSEQSDEYKQGLRGDQELGVAGDAGYAVHDVYGAKQNPQ